MQWGVGVQRGQLGRGVAFPVDGTVLLAAARNGDNVGDFKGCPGSGSGVLLVVVQLCKQEVQRLQPHEHGRMNFCPVRVHPTDGVVLGQLLVVVDRQGMDDGDISSRLGD